VRQAQGDLTGALAAYQAALAIRQRLTQQDPVNVEWQWDLAISHDRIGAVRQAQGDLAGALAAYQASLAIRQPLAQQDPTNAEWQRGLSVSHEQIGDVRRAQGDLAGALAAYQASLAIRQPLAQQDPTNAGWQRELSFSHERIGVVRQLQGDLAGALAADQASFAIRQRLAQQDPANAEWQRDLAASYARLGELYAQQGDPQARTFFEKSLEIATKLFASTQAAEAPRFLAIVYTHLVDVCTAQGDTQAALDYQRQALDYQRQFVVQLRQLANPPDLANALVTLSSLENKAGHTRATLDVATEVLKLARDLHTQRNNDDSRRLLAQVLGHQSFFLLFDRQFTEAIAAAEEALALDPNQRFIATNQAHGYLLSGQFEKAETIYRQRARDKRNARKTFTEVVLDDFSTLRQHGIVHPDMKKIEKLLRAEERPPP
jgi:tetratricopeptide (TPR) repeat protein